MGVGHRHHRSLCRLMFPKLTAIPLANLTTDQLSNQLLIDPHAE